MLRVKDDRITKKSISVTAKRKKIKRKSSKEMDRLYIEEDLKIADASKFGKTRERQRMTVSDIAEDREH